MLVICILNGYPDIIALYQKMHAYWNSFIGLTVLQNAQCVTWWKVFPWKGIIDTFKWASGTKQFFWNHQKIQVHKTLYFLHLKLNMKIKQMSGQVWRKLKLLRQPWYLKWDYVLTRLAWTQSFLCLSVWLMCSELCYFAHSLISDINNRKATFSCLISNSIFFMKLSPRFLELQWNNTIILHV